MSELFDGAHVANRSQQCCTQKGLRIDIYDAWNSFTPSEYVAVKNPQEGYIDFKCFVIARTDNELYIPWSIVFARWFEFISPDASSFLQEPPLSTANREALFWRINDSSFLSWSSSSIEIWFTGSGDIKIYIWICHLERIWVKRQNCDLYNLH